jgi:DNA-directed RNA polymerase subunit RPC12/RpoP
MAQRRMKDSRQYVGEDGHSVYVCANCNREVNVVFYVGDEGDNPRWACDMCVMSQKRKQ